MFTLILILSAASVLADNSMDETHLLNELPLENLLKMKKSLHSLVTTENVFDNVTATSSPAVYETFGAQALPLRSPVKRTDYEESLVKKGDSKISNIFAMSVTTLAFLAFGGYLLCLVVQAVKAKQATQPSVTNPTTVFVTNSGIKKRPQPQFASYGRKKRENRREEDGLIMVDLPPDQLFSTLIHLCEGYAKWSERFAD